MVRYLRTQQLLLTALALLWVAGCSSADGPGPQNTNPQQGAASMSAAPSIMAPPSSCGANHQGHRYTKGFTQTGNRDALRVRLVDMEPAVPIKGNNHWVVQVVDTTGRALDGVTINIKPFMPDHGHPSSIVPTIKPRNDGTYDITNLVLFMPGYWTLTFALTSSTVTSDQTVFDLCVEG